MHGERGWGGRGAIGVRGPRTLGGGGGVVWCGAVRFGACALRLLLNWGVCGEIVCCRGQGGTGGEDRRCVCVLAVSVVWCWFG